MEKACLTLTTVSNKRKWFSKMRVTSPVSLLDGTTIQRPRLLGPLLIVIALTIFWPPSAKPLWAQSDARQRYDSALQEWKDVYAQVVKVRSEFLVCEEEDADAIRDRLSKLKKEGEALLDKTIDAAIECVAEATTPDPEQIELLRPLPEQFYEQSRYARSAAAGDALLKHLPDEFPLVFNTLRSAFFCNRFSRAAELFEKINSKPDWLGPDGKMLPELMPLYETLPELSAMWDREEELREVERLKNNLPRIACETTKGTVIVELFEDQHPAVVNNLMALIENETEPYFNDLSVFFCLKHQYAVTGSQSDDGSQVLPLGAVSEEDIAKSRGNFHGSFSLDIRQRGAQKIVTTACQFVQIPIPELNDSTLVLGRVVEGMDVVAKLEKTHELDESFEIQPREAVVPDRLISITVLRKPEGKVYKPAAPSQ